MSHPILHFDYEFSPYGQKTKVLLDAAGVDYQRVDQSPVLPRKDLEDLGITYRRIPLLAVGKDVYADSALIIDVILNQLAKKEVPTTVADKAWEALGYDAFIAVLFLVPQAFLTPDFVKDRETIFPVLKRPDYKTVWPSSVADLQSRLDFLENTALAKGTYIGGDQLSLADIHVIWGIRWALSETWGLGASKADPKRLGKEAYPKVWKLIESLPDPKPTTVSGEEAIKTIEGASYSVDAGTVLEDDPIGIKKGTAVTVESMDAVPGSHPQAGKLIATSKEQIVLELKNGIHLHFPRTGYIVREA